MNPAPETLKLPSLKRPAQARVTYEANGTQEAQLCSSGQLKILTWWISNMRGPLQGFIGVYEDMKVLGLRDQGFPRLGVHFGGP